MIHTQIIDGKARADALRASVADGVKALASHGRPGLAVVLVGDDPASSVYVRNKGRQTEASGMTSFEYRMPATLPEDDLIAFVRKLNVDPAVHGILVQLPLPRHIATERVLAEIDPAKDVDGFHVVNAERLATGLPGLVPCTPLGCMILAKDVVPSLAGKKAVVVGRSNIVGKPMAQFLHGDDRPFPDR